MSTYRFHCKGIICPDCGRWIIIPAEWLEPNLESVEQISDIVQRINEQLEIESLLDWMGIPYAE